MKYRISLLIETTERDGEALNRDLGWFFSNAHTIPAEVLEFVMVEEPVEQAKDENNV